MTSIYQGITSAAFTVTATADADTGGVIAHAISPQPLIAVIQPLATQDYVGQDNLALPGPTTVAYNKGTAVGTGLATPRMLVWVLLPHSIIM